MKELINLLHKGEKELEGYTFDVSTFNPVYMYVHVRLYGVLLDEMSIAKVDEANNLKHDDPKKGKYRVKFFSDSFVDADANKVFQMLTAYIKQRHSLSIYTR